MKKSIFISCLILSFAQSLYAQNLSFYGWLPAISQTGRISKKVDYNIFISATLDATNRTIANVEYPARFLQLYIQPSIIYKFNANFNVSASYTYQRNNPFTTKNGKINADYSNEHRFWQQMVFGHTAGKVRFTHRLRFEERFVQRVLARDATGKITSSTYYSDSDNAAINNPFRTRLRYQFAINCPLQGKTLDKGEFYLNAYNEFYISTTGIKNPTYGTTDLYTVRHYPQLVTVPVNPNHPTYNENWTYLGIGYSLGAMGKIEMGFLLQIATRNLVHDLRVLNLIQTTWITSFNPAPKKK